MMKTLAAGTVLYHGTSSSDFDEQEDGLDGPAWLSDSAVVAERFALRNQSEGCRPRVLSFVLEEDVELHLIQSAADLSMMSEEHGISFDGVEEMRDTVIDSGIPGWVIPNNYPEGADILMANTGALRHESTRVMEPAPASRPRMRPR